MYKYFIAILLFSCLNASQHDKFIIVTPEKTGTFLLCKIIEECLQKPVFHIWTHDLQRLDLVDNLNRTEQKGEIYHAHCFPSYALIYELKKRGYKVLFLIRDPRDQVVSALFFILKWNWRIASYDKRELPFAHLTFDEQMHELITGRRYGYSVLLDITKKHLEWMEQDPEFVHVLRFEDLIGSKGYGSDDVQLATVYNMLTFIGVDMPIEQVQTKLQNVYGKSLNFRAGKIGDWKIFFNEVNKEAFKMVFGLELIHLGYESDYEW